MDKDIMIAIVLSVIVIALSFWKNQFLMGSFVFLIIVAVEIAYRVYLKYIKTLDKQK
jgi:4-hydroxybenzoate polyprenyltransferase